MTNNPTNQSRPSLPAMNFPATYSTTPFDVVTCDPFANYKRDLKLSLLALFTEAGRNLPMTVGDAVNPETPVQKLLDKVDEAGLSYEFVGRSLSLRKEVRAAELFNSCGYVANL